MDGKGTNCRDSLGDGDSTDGRQGDAETRAVTGKIKYAGCLPVKNRLDKWGLLRQAQDRQTGGGGLKARRDEGFDESVGDWPHLY